MFRKPLWGLSIVKNEMAAFQEANFMKTWPQIQILERGITHIDREMSRDLKLVQPTLMPVSTKEKNHGLGTYDEHTGLNRS